MKKILFILSLALSSYLLHSQVIDDIQIENISINKDTTFFAEILNNTQNEILLLKAHIIDSSKVFQFAGMNNKKIRPGEKLLLPITFSPKDNINYTAFLNCEIVTDNSQFSLLSKIVGKATHPLEIYRSTDNLRGRQLLDELKKFVEPHTSLGYKNAREFMWGNLDNVNGYVECIYTGRKVQTTGIPDVNTTNFNTEHTWPQAYGADNDPPKSDLYHIRPSYEVANSKRANYPFGFVKSNVTYEDGGSRLGVNASGNIVFEPRSSVKGDIARGMFYFALKYNNPYGYINNQLKDLREFALLDPVDSSEYVRNIRISEVQNNRNPFIDNNYFVFRINNFENPDFIPFSIPVVSNQNIYLLNQNNSEAFLYLANYGDDTLYIINHSFNQWNNGKSYFFRFDRELNGLTLYPYQIEKVKVILEANEPVDDSFEADLNLFFSNSTLIPVTFKVRNNFTTVEDFSPSIKAFQNESYLMLASDNICIDELYIYTIEGKVFDFSSHISNMSFLQIPKSTLYCTNCVLFISGKTSSGYFIKKILVE
ncbi:MAG: endonuclease [Bacteroidota bacterium]